jgi:hypothetical protein
VASDLLADDAKTVAPAVALLYVPVGGKGLRVVPKKSGSGFPWLVILPLAIAAVLIVVLIVWLVSSRRMPTAPK